MTKPTATSSGFVFGAASVEARASYSEGKARGETTVIAVATGYDDIEIYVSPSGRTIRVFRKGWELRA